METNNTHKVQSAIVNVLRDIREGKKFVHGVPVVTNSYIFLRHAELAQDLIDEGVVIKKSPHEVKDIVKGALKGLRNSNHAVEFTHGKRKAHFIYPSAISSKGVGEKTILRPRRSEFDFHFENESPNSFRNVFSTPLIFDIFFEKGNFKKKKVNK